MNAIFQHRVRGTFYAVVARKPTVRIWIMQIRFDNHKSSIDPFDLGSIQTSLFPFFYGSLNNEKKDRASHSNEQTTDIKTGNAPQSQSRADKSANKSARYTQNDGDEDTTWIFTRHNKFGDYSND
jgi:hypothetical protein